MLSISATLQQLQVVLLILLVKYIRRCFVGNSKKLTEYRRNIKLNELKSAVSILSDDNAILKESLKSETIKQVDTFTKSGETTSVIYSNLKAKKLNYISMEQLYKINNTQVLTATKQKGGNQEIWRCDDFEFTIDQIPPINKKTLSEIKSNENVIDFKQNQFFKYVDSNGEEHLLFSSENGVNWPVFPESQELGTGSEADKYQAFWNYLKDDYLMYISMSFSDEEIQEFLDYAEIEKGFFTMKTGGESFKIFYTDSKYHNLVQSQREYDERYNYYARSGYLKETGYEPGDVFQLGEDEYILNDDYTIDVPYGEDIFKLYGPRERGYDHSGYEADNIINN